MHLDSFYVLNIGHILLHLRCWEMRMDVLLFFPLHRPTIQCLKFIAQIIIGGTKTYLGTYETVKEAAIACDRAVLKANRSISLLNFPDMVHNLDVEPKPYNTIFNLIGF